MPNTDTTLIVRIAGLIEGRRWVRGLAESEALEEVERISSVSEFYARMEDGLTPSERFALRIAGRHAGSIEERAFWRALPLGEDYRDDSAYLEAFLDGARQEIRARAER